MMRLVYSADDGGYYWEDDQWRQSQLFRTHEEAMQARRSGKLRWEHQHGQLLADEEPSEAADADG
ncbi:MAG TPA: hypothetical protein VNK04_01215 [Gemmataceae bacterium]|nr:hypothetical protein [Gemmataceae bacterium]